MFLACTFAPPAHAIYFLPEGFDRGVYARVEVDYDPEDGPHQYLEESVHDPDLAPYPVPFVLTTANEAVHNSAATVIAVIGPGFLRLDAIAVATHQGEGSSEARVHAGAAFGDVITLSAPGLNGSPGTVRLGALVDGGVSTAHSAFDFTPISAYAFGGAAFFFRTRHPAAGGSVSDVLVEMPCCGHPSFFNPAELFQEEFMGGEVSFVYGEPFSFSFILEIQGSATVRVSEPLWGATSTFVGDFGSTATWAGILDLRDADGMPVTDFEVTSLSGTDYRDRIVPTPVPEPGTALSLVAGLTLLGLRGRQSRKARHSRARSGRSLSAPAAGVLVGAVFAPSAHAQPIGFTSGVYGQVSVQYEPAGSAPQLVSDYRYDPEPVTYPPPFVLTVSNEAGLASAATVVGQVGHGFARLDAIAIAAQQGTGRSRAWVEAGAAFGDTITFSAPGLGGTSGTVHLGTFLDGGISSAHSGLPGTPVDANANGRARLRYTVGSGIGAGLLDARVSTSACCGENPAENFGRLLYDAEVSIVFGQPLSFAFLLLVAGEATAEVESPTWMLTSTFVGDFGHTMTWAGILDLRDADGMPVPDFEVTSLSGTDYRDPITPLPVPEPGTALPVLVGLAALARRR